MQLIKTTKIVSGNTVSLYLSGEWIQDHMSMEEEPREILHTHENHFAFKFARSL